MTDMSADLGAAIGAGDLDAAAAALEELVRAEDERVLANIMKPYEDQVPQVLQQRSPEQVAAVLDRLPTAVVKRVLFGSYARIPDERLRALVSAMAPDRAARLVEAMAVGIDAPRELARVLGGGEDDVRPVLELAHPAALLRVLDELGPAAQRRLVRVAGPRALERLDAELEDQRDHLRRDWLQRLVDDREAEPAAAVDLELLQAGPAEHAATHLATVPWPAVRHVVRSLPVARVASLVVRLAGEEPERAAALLEGADRRLLLRPPVEGAPVAEWLHESRTAAVLGALDHGDPASARLLAAMRPEHLELVVPHVPWERRAPIEAHLGSAGGLPFGIEVLGVGSGRRRSSRLGVGRWVRIEEDLDTGVSRQPITVDLIEVPLDAVRLEARMAVADEQALPVREIASVFEAYRAAGTRPSPADFARFGLVQLSKEVERTGAAAAINGNFYFDYGHYTNGTTLGIDMASVPGLFFGDPIGWFVSGGRELAPPSFNRASAMVTADGALHVDRVLMDRVQVGEHAVTWDAVNVAKADGGTILYTSLFGFRTEPGSSHVDVACARGRVWEVRHDGASVIPLTGFVLSVPTARAAELLGDVAPGVDVRSGSEFERRHGPVVEAMACGPLLVRDGVADVDFVAEDFGQQDSTVMSFFLPRTVETYRAARSFLGMRGRTLVLGAVSGTAYGFGSVRTSAGTTFGELAQLCVDLGLDTAYALDGGGSSSVVGRRGGVPTVLNAPTGGADVAAGEERFINTYWLVHRREEQP